MPTDHSNLVLHVENILRKCADGTERVSCATIVDGDHLQALTCTLKGPSPNLDVEQLFKLAPGEPKPMGGYLVEVCGQRHSLYVTVEPTRDN